MSEGSQNEGESEVIESIERTNQAASKGPLSTLLNPSFEILGNRLADWTARVFEKKESNNKEHVEAVRERIGETEREPNEIMLENLSAWEKHAGNYSEDDPQAAVWRGVLEKILTENEPHKDLIETASQMTAGDLYVLNKLQDGPIGLDPVHIPRRPFLNRNSAKKTARRLITDTQLLKLESLGLAASAKSINLYYIYVFLFSGAFLLGMLGFQNITSIADPFYYIERSYYIIFFVFCVFLLILPFARNVPILETTVYISSNGQLLLSLIAPYDSDKP